MQCLLRGRSGLFGFFHMRKGEENHLVNQFVPADVSLCRFLVQEVQHLPLDYYIWLA